MTDSIEEQRHKVTVEVFDLTGKKMSPDDPATTAALFYSSLVRKATEELKQTGLDLRSELRAAVEKQAAVAVNEELIKQKGRLTGYVEGMQRKLKDAASAVPPAAGSIQIRPLTAAIAVALAAAVSALGVVFIAPNGGLSASERTNIIYGNVLRKVYGTLDSKAQAKIDAALAEEAK